MNHPLLYTTFALYLLAGILYLLQLIFSESPLAKTAARLTGLSWLLQTVMLGMTFFSSGYPFLIESDVSYAFTAWVAALAFLLLNLKYRFQVVGAFVLPLISIFY